MKQSITLTGCGSTSFQLSRDNIEHLTSYLKAGSHETGHVAVDSSVQVGLAPSIEATNRYFTPSKDVGELDVLDIPTNWDPLHILQRIRGHDLVFTEENMVEFNKAVKKSDDSMRYVDVFQQLNKLNSYSSFETISPATIQTGDIVSIEITHMLVPLVNDHIFKMKAVTVLRAVTLQTTKFTVVSRLCKTYSSSLIFIKDAISKHIHVREKPLKRRLALTSVASTKRMRVDENAADDLEKKVDEQMNISSD